MRSRGPFDVETHADELMSRPKGKDSRGCVSALLHNRANIEQPSRLIVKIENPVAHAIGYSRCTHRQALKSLWIFIFG